MNEPPQNAAPPKQTGQTDPVPVSQEMIDLLIAISVVARHLARKLEAQDRGEKTHEQNERPVTPAD